MENRRRNTLFKVVTALAVVAILGCAVYIMANLLGLSPDYDFGAGAYGLRDAARKYFGKDPALLTIPESAMLAAMPYAPSALNPYENPSGCAKRVRLVLKEMLRYGYIGNTEYKDALAQGVVLKNGRTLLLE